MERLTDCAQGYCEMYCKEYGRCFDEPVNCAFHNEVKLYEALKSIEGIVPLERLLELADADRHGRLVVLDEPREPLVWGDDNRDTILCPNCNHDLMGGFPEGDSCETPMYQCPYCGQPIDGTRALTREEAEAALSGKGGDG